MADRGRESMIECLSASSRAEIDHWIAKYPEDRKQSAVLSALTIAQAQNDGWLTPELMDAVAEYLGMPRVSVYEVATFYSMLYTKPIGRHKIAICNNISCMLCGAEEIIRHVEQRLGIRLGETTPDGNITLKVEEECLAACAGAPMMAVDGHYHEHLTPAKVDAILDSLE
ncbi:MAG: NADH-quinone oxidoreductase subunit E [Chromatiales bacterium 21-64-14]|nr:MAG: NADH-quinone oxidoreductase subunit E [Chromatiales bacterium 21-64-14]HQU15440.1 NADH-quinone oxidoreductase subunit NuoE [Gammaproteobacteria bacterium]